MTTLTLEPLAARLRWRFAQALTGDEWGAVFAEHLESLAKRCVETEAGVIGHIKGLAVVPGGGYVRVNLVSPLRPADIESTASSSCARLTFDLNVLVYGLSFEQVRQMTLNTAAMVASRRGGLISIEVFVHSAQAHA